MNINKLKAKLTEAELTYKQFAEKCDIPHGTIVRRLTKEGCATITVGEIEKMSKALKLTHDEVAQIFLSK